LRRPGPDASTAEAPVSAAFSRASAEIATKSKETATGRSAVTERTGASREAGQPVGYPAAVEDSLVGK
jgi:hypothetical protein